MSLTPPQTFPATLAGDGLRDGHMARARPTGPQKTAPGLLLEQSWVWEDVRADAAEPIKEILQKKQNYEMNPDSIPGLF